MAEIFEPVHEVADYIDHPLKGVADFGGVPHRFCLIGWVSPPPEVAAESKDPEAWLLDHWDPVEDRYELAPVASVAGPVVWARATFSDTVPGFEPPPVIRVKWRSVPVTERLHRIIEAQRWGGPPGCDLGTPAYLCLGFWLSDPDLEDVRPDLRQDGDYPDVGEVGRYQSISVFPAAERPTELSSWGYFQGIWFVYLPCLAVD